MTCFWLSEADCAAAVFGIVNFPRKISAREASNGQE